MSEILVASPEPGLPPLAFPVLSPETPRVLYPGQDAPNFSALDHQGHPVHKADLAGRRYVLWFYPKADTPG